jgi:hypothetical protein
MLKQERADGDDAEQRVEFTPDETGALSGLQRLNTCMQFGRGS